MDTKHQAHIATAVSAVHAAAHRTSAPLNDPTWGRTCLSLTAYAVHAATHARTSHELRLGLTDSCPTSHAVLTCTIL